MVDEGRDNNGNRTCETTGGVTKTFNYDAFDRMTSVVQGCPRHSGGEPPLPYLSLPASETVGSAAASARLIGRRDALAAPRPRVWGWPRHPRPRARERRPAAPDSKRLSLTDSSGTRKFFYDRNDVIQEYNSNWSSVTREYTHGPWVDEPLSMTDHMSKEANNTHYLMKDRLGSIINILDESETLKTTYSYDAFGEPTATYHSGQVDCMYRFTGRVYDGTMGAYFYRARYYNQSLGRFFSRDPIMSLGSLYAYCNNSPANFTDPSGRISSSINAGSFNMDVANIVSASIQGGSPSDPCSRGIEWPWWRWILTTDSDGDGWCDEFEEEKGTDPNDADSQPEDTLKNRMGNAIAMRNAADVEFAGFLSDIVEGIGSALGGLFSGGGSGGESYPDGGGYGYGGSQCGPGGTQLASYCPVGFEFTSGNFGDTFGGGMLGSLLSFLGIDFDPNSGGFQI